MNSLEFPLESYERQRKLRRSLYPQNKDTILYALHFASITLVLVTFDGEGDSGQIEKIIGMRGETAAELPKIKLRYQRAVWGEKEPEISELLLEDAIEALCYDLLEDEHDGWEINEGSFGEFCINVAKHGVTLEFSARIVEYSTTHHSF